MNNEEKILEILTQMKNQLNNLENKVDSNHNEVIQNINEISDDLDFLSHKELQTEKEIFNLKKRLPNINRDIRQIKSTLSKVEIVTADNWSDIAKIKANKRHRAR